MNFTFMIFHKTSVGFIIEFIHYFLEYEADKENHSEHYLFLYKLSLIILQLHKLLVSKQGADDKLFSRLNVSLCNQF